MAREIPEVVRAAAGLAATVLDETRRLPETLPGLPVRLLGMAMQVSMKMQQQYAGLVARGDELFTGIHGEEEPGLATFDDDESVPAAETAGHTSAFDRAAETIIEVTEESDTVEASAADEVLADLAIEELVDAAPAPSPEGAAALDDELLQAERERDADGLPEEEVLAASPADVDVLAPDGSVATVEGTVTDEGVATVEGGPVEGGPATAVDEGGAPVAEVTQVETSLEAPATPPVDGYDDFSIAQLRGHLRGYARKTVQELLDYEQSTQAREPYLRMLRNRLERLDADNA